MNCHQPHHVLTGSPEGPVILFLHGFLGSGADWENIVSRLSEQFRCLAVDLPGHGKTTDNLPEKCYSMENTAAAVIALLDWLQISRCYLVGYSMGGRLALYLALRYSARFFKVVLESASPGLKTAALREERRRHDEALARQLESGNFEAFLKKWYDQPLFASLKQQPDFPRLFERRLQQSPRELAKSLRNIGSGVQPSLWEELTGIQIPLLLAVGESDIKFRAIAREMAVVSPKVKIKIIAGCGHNIHFEDPAAFTECIRNFFIE